MLLKQKLWGTVLVAVENPDGVVRATQGKRLGLGVLPTHQQGAGVGLCAVTVSSLGDTAC